MDSLFLRSKDGTKIKPINAGYEGSSSEKHTKYYVGAEFDEPLIIDDIDYITFGETELKME